MYTHLEALQHISAKAQLSPYRVAQALLPVAMSSRLDAAVNRLLVVGNKKLPQAGVPVLLDMNAKKRNQFRYRAEDRPNVSRRRGKHRLRPAGAQDSRKPPRLPPGESFRRAGLSSRAHRLRGPRRASR